MPLPAQRQPGVRRDVGHEHDRERKSQPGRTVAAGGTDQVDDDADPPLRGEAAGEQQQVERRVGATGKRLGKAFAEHAIGEDVHRRAQTVQRPPEPASRKAPQDHRQRGEADRVTDGEQLHRMNAPPGEPGREEAQDQVAAEHHRAHQQQVPRRAGAIVSAHLHQPRHRPQALDRHERPHAERAQRREPPEAPAREHRLHAGPLRGEAAAGPLRGGGCPARPPIPRAMANAKTDSATNTPRPVRDPQCELDRRASRPAPRRPPRT